MKMLGECGDVLEVQSNGSGSVVSPLELFQHALASWVIITPPKRDDPIYASERFSILLPQSGFVQQVLCAQNPSMSVIVIFHQPSCRNAASPAAFIDLASVPDLRFQPNIGDNVVLQGVVVGVFFQGLQLQIISSVNCGHAPRRQIGTACG